METMRFIGLDLAWSVRNPTGAAVISGDAQQGTLAASALLGGDDEVIAWVAEQAGPGPAIVAIDAPLVVPNQTGRRLAEAEIGQAFARFQAGAHPANRARLAVDGVVRGEALVTRLEQLGFVHAPEVRALAPVRQVLEVFPHPAMVALFDLQRTIKYKARPGRTLDTRLAEFRRLQTLMRGLTAPALVGADELLSHPLDFPVRARLKDYEDRLDGVFCAYIAHYLWRWGMARARVFGSLTLGSITTPVPPAMWPER